MEGHAEPQQAYKPKAKSRKSVPVAWPLQIASLSKSFKAPHHAERLVLDGSNYLSDRANDSRTGNSW